MALRSPEASPREWGLFVMQAKADLVYNAIQGSDGFYNSPVDPACRSLMNIPFTIPASQDLEKKFISEAAKEGMVRYRVSHRLCIITLSGWTMFKNMSVRRCN